MEVYGKTITGLGPKEEYQACNVDTLAAMYATCNMFLMHCFDFSKSNNDLSFQKVHFLKQKSLRLQKKSLISR